IFAAQPTRLVFFESPTNPVTKIADIGSLTRLARAAGALAVMDNTFAGFHQHGDYDVDVFVHSLTKYASGTGDVMGGAVIARAARQMRDFGTIVSFELKGGGPAVRRFADTLELFALAASLGSTESLVVTPQMMGARELSAEQQRISAITEGTVRLSIGLEDPDDLLEDLSRALGAA